MSTTAQLLPRGEIVDIRWGDQRDRRWLRTHVTLRFWREVNQLPQLLRREMSVYRCIDCGSFGVYEGVDDSVLLLWTLKGRRCASCAGCECEDCRAERET